MPTVRTPSCAALPRPDGAASFIGRATIAVRGAGIDVSSPDTACSGSGDAGSAGTAVSGSAAPPP